MAQVKRKVAQGTTYVPSSKSAWVKKTLLLAAAPSDSAEKTVARATPGNARKRSAARKVGFMLVAVWYLALDAEVYAIGRQHTDRRGDLALSRLSPPLRGLSLDVHAGSTGPGSERPGGSSR